VNLLLCKVLDYFIDVSPFIVTGTELLAADRREVFASGGGMLSRTCADALILEEENLETYQARNQ
jgi:hypothetical protein